MFQSTVNYNLKDLFDSIQWISKFFSQNDLFNHVWKAYISRGGLMIQNSPYDVNQKRLLRDINFVWNFLYVVFVINFGDFL